VTIPLLLGLGTGLGLVLLWYAAVPSRPSIAHVLSRVHTAAEPQRRPPAGRLSRVVFVVATGIETRHPVAPSVRADLALLDATTHDLLSRQVVGGIAGLAVTPLLWALTAATGVPVPPPLPAWAGVLAALVGGYAPYRNIRRQAADRRRDFRIALGAYLDLAAMRLASGAGLAEALRDAASIGTGPALTRLRAELADTRSAALSHAAVLDRLGRDLDITDLRDLAAALSLVETSGARAEEALRAKAASLRMRELADAYGRANERSQSMLAAQAVLGLGFLLFLGYPALAVVAAS
jgi:tight adherence protein C